MGSYSHLLIGNTVISWGKNSLALGTELFCYEDKQKKYIAPFKSVDHTLTRKLNTILPRLELEGYTLKNAKRILLSNFSGSENKIAYADLVDKLLAIDFKNTHCDNIDNILLDNVCEYFIDPLALLRVLIDILDNKDIDLTLDYMDLYRGGWITKNFLSDIPNKFLILTEGKTDTEILKNSLRRIFPYIYPYFSFANMEENPFGGTTNLVKFIKGLNSIKYAENVIAIFDNDTAGNGAILEIPKQTMTNIQAISLPKHRKFSKFNTLGVSNKIIKKNINGSGVAIECFLDLPDDACIRWVSYDEKLKQYQGCFNNHSKKEYFHKFIKEVNNPKTNYNYEMLTYLWNYIIKTAVKMSEKKLISQYFK